MAAKPKGTIYYSKCDDGILMHIQINRGDASQRGGIILDKSKNYEFVEYRKTAEKNYDADFFATSDQVSFQWNTLPSVSDFTVYMLLKGVPADMPIKKINKIRGVFYYVDHKGKEKEIKLKENKKEVKPTPAVVEEPKEEPIVVEEIVEEVEPIETNALEPETNVVTEEKEVEKTDKKQSKKEQPNKNKPQMNNVKGGGTKKNTSQEDNKVSSRVYFKVQVASKANQEKLDNCKNYFYAQYNINNIEEETDETDGKILYKYVGKSLPTYRQAQLERDIYVSKGVLDAFIVGYIDGKRVDIQTAINAQKSK